MERHQAATTCMAMIQGHAVRSCELRLERQGSDVQGVARVEYLCGASGGPEQGYILAREGEDLSAMLTVCNRCPIPDALASHRACLNLVPVRRFPGGKHPLPVIQPEELPDQQHEPADASFTCRWFYTWYGQQQPRTIDMCLGCPHWFPRPPRELIPNYWPATRKMLRIVNGEESTARPPTGFAPTPPAPPGGWWRQIWRRLHF